MRVLQGEFRDGETIRIDVVDGDLRFLRADSAVTA
jgi:hypothetical protein